MASGGLYTQRSIIQDGYGAIYPRAPGQSSFPSYDNMMKMLLEKDIPCFSPEFYLKCAMETTGRTEVWVRYQKRAALQETGELMLFPLIHVLMLYGFVMRQRGAAVTFLGLKYFVNSFLSLHFFPTPHHMLPDLLHLSRVTPRWLHVA